MLYALDEQVRRYEAEGKVKKYEGWEFLSAIIDCKGRGARHYGARICARWSCVPSRPTRSFWRRAAIGAIFGKSTNSVVCTGSAQSAIFQQGAYYANGEFIQVHPT